MTLSERLRAGLIHTLPECIEAADALDAKDARIKELEGKIHEQKIWMHAEIDSLSGEIRRFGCPYVSTVSSQEDGFYLEHQIISATPTPAGLRVVIASTRAREALK